MFAAVAGVFGLVFGSFATVLIERIPEGKDIVFERSHCTRCGAQIRWYHNVPVLSWLALRGKCRDCGLPISVMYPIVELTVGALWVLSYLRFGVSWQAVLLCVLAPISVALVVIDLRKRRLPHALVFPTYAVVLVIVAAGAVTSAGHWVTSLIGLAAMGGFYGLLWLVYPRGMGFGDVTTAGVLGAAAGFLGLPHLAVAGIAGPLLGGVMVLALALGGKVRKGTAVPYGPALIAGAWVGFLSGDIITDAYLGLLGVG